MPGWRSLGRFWTALVVLAAAGAIALQAMGPPAPPPAAAHASVPGRVASAPAAPAAPPPAMLASASPAMPPVPDGAIRAPDPALLEPAPDFPGQSLPRIAADGRTALRSYARAAGPVDKRPKVAILVVGFGQAAADSQAAIDALPGAVTLGFSPYTPDPEPLLSAARAHGHEYLVTLPMESQGYPLNDSGPHALLTGADATANARNLEWVLSRMQGEIGLTGASDGLLGERFANAATPFGAAQHEIAARGLLYVDPRPGAAKPGSPSVTLVLDDPADRSDIDTKLGLLEQHARDTGAALGLAVLLRPVTVDRITAWAHGLDARGVDLVPVSALPQPQAAVQ